MEGLGLSAGFRDFIGRWVCECTRCQKSVIPTVAVVVPLWVATFKDSSHEIG